MVKCPSDQAAEKTELLKKIKLLLLDADGVLTDGSIVYSDSGSEIKTFNVKDGVGIRLLMAAGIKVGIVTGRSSDALCHRCRNLGIVLLVDGIRDKAAVLDRITGQTSIPAQKIAFMGDDLPDLPIMRRVGLSIAVSDADKAVIEHAGMVTKNRGGAGAVREVCEAILDAQGLREKITERFL
ncbi:HAD-IIIA family hydrolase [Desulfococcaceae bacterium HSG8]|nr:HAD-IIIA family hydrolase [Desulfococcaceae bacterium HSG8]